MVQIKPYFFGTSKSCGSSNTGICTFAGSGGNISGCATSSNWYGTFRGRVGYRSDVKFAVVTLAEGSKIDITTGL